jgi:hypothetical protein
LNSIAAYKAKKVVECQIVEFSEICISQKVRLFRVLFESCARKKEISLSSLNVEEVSVEDAVLFFCNSDKAIGIQRDGNELLFKKDRRSN